MLAWDVTNEPKHFNPPFAFSLLGWVQVIYIDPENNIGYYLTTPSIIIINQNTPGFNLLSRQDSDYYYGGAC